MGKEQKPKKSKVIYPKGEPTPSVESQYQVSFLIGAVDEAGKRTGGQWEPEAGTRVSFGRKALVRELRRVPGIGQFRVRKVA